MQNELRDWDLKKKLATPLLCEVILHPDNFKNLVYRITSIR